MTPTKPVAEIVAELNRLRIAAGDGTLRMSGGGLDADKVAEWMCYLVENSDFILAELQRTMMTEERAKETINKMNQQAREVIEAEESLNPDQLRAIAYWMERK